MPQQDSQGNYPTIKDFVLQQAHERAFQINVMGLKDFERERSMLLNQRQNQLHDQIQKKQKQQLASARIHRSSLINGNRMKKMEARHKNILQIVSETQGFLQSKATKDKSYYGKLLKQLILQGLIKMLQPFVYVRCLERDRDLVESVLSEAKSEFKALIKREGIQESVGNIQLVLDTRYYLRERKVDIHDTERAEKTQQNSPCFGGVVLTNQDGLIICKNTLDSRIQLAYQHMLPTIRKQLFN